MLALPSQSSIPKPEPRVDSFHDPELEIVSVSVVLCAYQTEEDLIAKVRQH